MTVQELTDTNRTLKHHSRKLDIYFNSKYFDKYVKRKTMTSFTPKVFYMVVKTLFPWMRSKYFDLLTPQFKKYDLSYRQFLFILYIYTFKDEYELLTYEIIQKSFMTDTGKTATTNAGARAIVRKMHAKGFIKKEGFTNARGNADIIYLTPTPKALEVIKLVHEGFLKQISIIEKTTGHPLSYTDYSMFDV